MSIYLDSANLREIDEAGVYPFLAGVTTNPKLIARVVGSPSIAQEHFMEYLKKIHKAITGDLFVQTNHNISKHMVNEALCLKELIGEQLVVKIPATLPGFQAIHELHNKNIRTAATAVFTGVQAYTAILCGADYVIPYYSRITSSMKDGLEVIEDILTIVENGGFECQVLVASLKSPYDVLEVLRVGVHAITLPADLLAAILSNSQTMTAVNEFMNSLSII